jgi:DNA topoisomerase-1
MKNLVIVESPAKAKTIEKYLGSGYTVTSSMGHIRDLSRGDNAIDIKNGFKPKYEVDADKKELVKKLKKMAQEAEVVWLATDEDREGEAISWHLFETLGLKEDNTKRIVFNEITKPAILKAVENPRTIDKYLVDAQQARRVLDRLVGFELSPILWRRVSRGLSAGRVQSVAVRLIVEREREINAFESRSEFKITALFTTQEGKTLKAELNKKFSSEAEAVSFLNQVQSAIFKVLNTEVKPTHRNPAPPFTTSTLQQEASRKLGYDVTKTMSLAQRLYENGHITYMRTDSVNMSQLATAAAKDQITAMFGAEYSQFRKFSNKNESAQEAHEAIRPTYFDKTAAGDDPQQKKLYDLIWKRAVASQMKTADLEKTTISIGNSANSETFVAEGEVIKFDGFLRLYMESNDDDDEKDEEGVLPRVTINDELNYSEIKAEEKFSRPAARYSEAALVNKLEELGIGRHSTYAPTISTIQKRGYVTSESRDGKTRNYVSVLMNKAGIKREVKTENYGAEKKKLFPTDMGMLVTDFLLQHFDQIMDYGFTASVEKEFDEIAEGNKGWQDMLQNFYDPFQENIQRTVETAARVTGERILGQDPQSGRTVLVRLGQYGPMVQIGARDDGQPQRFASIPRGITMENISLEEALKLFELPKKLILTNGTEVTIAVGRYGPYMKVGEKFHSLPKNQDLIAFGVEDAEAFLQNLANEPQFPIEIGEYDGHVLSVNKGRFGPYIKFGELFASLPKGTDPLRITLQEAIPLVEAKKEGEKAKIIKAFDQDKTLQIVKGQYGPYISHGKKNVKIPTGKKPEDLTYEDVMDLVKNAPDKKPTARRKK